MLVDELFLDALSLLGFGILVFICYFALFIFRCFRSRRIYAKRPSCRLDISGYLFSRLDGEEFFTEFIPYVLFLSFILLGGYLLYLHKINLCSIPLALTIYLCFVLTLIIVSKIFVFLSFHRRFISGFVKWSYIEFNSYMPPLFIRYSDLISPSCYELCLTDYRTLLYSSIVDSMFFHPKIHVCLDDIVTFVARYSSMYSDGRQHIRWQGKSLKRRIEEYLDIVLIPDVPECRRTDFFDALYSRSLSILRRSEEVDSLIDIYYNKNHFPTLSA